jgi:hypothetical protein
VIVDGEGLQDMLAHDPAIPHFGAPASMMRRACHLPATAPQ